MGNGACLAVLRLQGPVDIVASGYGRTLAAKLMVVRLALIVRWRGRHRSAPDGRRVWWRREASLSIVVLALAGLLGALPPR